MKLTNRQRENSAKTFFDFSKLILATIVLGQFIPGVKFNLGIFTGGLVLCIGCIILATLIDSGT
ncbi:MAG: hypothetical protein QME68_08165, partial [Elusimicrobiota bacterium]|nr:hypothetical protein [Elusimicrobiota bacterium]